MAEWNWLIFAKRISWVGTTALCFACARRGYSSWPAFETWFWGVSLTLDVLILLAILLMGRTS